MPTCPFCAGPLALTDRRVLEDLDGITNGLVVQRYACARGMRFVHELVQKYPDSTERWYFVRDDGTEVCLRKDPKGHSTCSDCAHPESERLCLADHGKLALADRPTLVKEHTVEQLTIEGATVDVEVTRHRCDDHGDDGQPHFVIRRDVVQ